MTTYDIAPDTAAPQTAASEAAVSSTAISSAPVPSTSVSPSAWALSRLSASRATTEPALRAAVSSLADPARTIARYQFGWCDSGGNAIEASGGKALRPGLVIAAAQAVGCDDLDRVLPGAAAVELLHNSSLLHDDIIDEDTERRHRPTAWTVFGQAQTILAGDALLSLAFEVLAAGSADLKPVRTLGRASRLLLDGQTMDVDFEDRDSVGVEECLAMAEYKTAALLGCSCALGAQLAGASDETVGALEEFGVHLGIAFQAVDDLLGIWGDAATTGKPVGSDLRQRKHSLPVTSALNAPCPPQDLVAAYASRGELGNEDVFALTVLLETAGARDWTQKLVEERLMAAELALGRAGISAEGASDLRKMALFVTERRH